MSSESEPHSSGLPPVAQSALLDDPELLQQFHSLQEVIREEVANPPPSPHENFSELRRKLETSLGSEGSALGKLTHQLETGEMTQEQITGLFFDRGVTYEEMESTWAILQRSADAQMEGNGGSGDQALIDSIHQKVNLLTAVMKDAALVQLEGWDNSQYRRARANQAYHEKGQPVPFPGELGKNATEQVVEPPAGISEPKTNNKEQSQAEGSLLVQNFAEARQQNRGIGDEFIDDFLSGNLRQPNGEPVLDIKNYLDFVALDDRDKEFAQDPEQLAEVHSAIQTMIAENLRVRLEPNSDSSLIAQLQAAKSRLLERLDTTNTRPFFVAEANGQREGLNARDLLYGSLLVDREGKKIDLLDFTGEKFDGVRPNISIQTEVNDRFIHWSSDRYAEGKVDGELKGTDLSHRIYLNPVAAESVEIFTKIMQAANQAGLRVHGKLLDKSEEGRTVGAALRRGQQAKTRADEVVLGTLDESQADELLAIVEAVSKDHAAAFRGRPTARAAMKVGEGIAIGDEPDVRGYSTSLTTHRASLLSQAQQGTLKHLGLGSDEKVPPALLAQARAIFRQEFSRVASRDHVNPNNPAFNNTPRKPKQK